ncbi:transporter [Flavobacterium artemisiae]|uniref:Transporter n=1 Tax=Flavobacterium artemisiae TaxID=2126556 RepID=A0ABW4HIN6_9FLAO
MIQKIYYLNMKLLPQIIAIGLFYFSSTVSAQQIQTDRPNETESPNTISVHHLQVESGFSFEQQEGEKAYEIPEIVLRYGIFKNAEFRIESAFTIDHDHEEDSDGIKPIIFGAKYHLIDHKGIIPDISLLGRLSIPWMADHSLQEQKYSPEIRMLAQYSLSKSAHLGYNLGVHWLSDTGRPEYIYTISGDYALTKKIKLVAEVYGLTESHHHAKNTADVAVLYVVNKKVQLDFITGSGIMHANSEKFAELGLSFKI